MSTATLEAIPTIRETYEPAEPEEDIEVPDGYEFVDGEFRERNVSYLSCYVASEIACELRNHTKPRKLGTVNSEGPTYSCFPGQPRRVRRADAAFHLLHRLTAEQARAKGNCPVVPDIVIEVSSPNDLLDDVYAKRVEWLGAGAQLVWIAVPAVSEIHVFRADGSSSILKSSDTLTGEPVLPEFRVAVGELFRLPGE